MSRRRHVGDLLKVRERHTLLLQRAVVTYYRKLARAVGKGFLNFGKEGVESALNMAQTDITNILIDQAQSTANAMGNKQLDVIEQILRKDFHADFAQQMQFFIAARALKTATLTNGTDRAQAAGIISRGFTDGDTNREIAIALQSRFTNIATAYRAARISRTETNIAAAQSQELAAKDSGVDLVKEWVSNDDGRVRGTEIEDKFNHTASRGGPDGQIRELDALFQVGIDRMKGPHDPTASAGNIINCRCVANYIPRSIL